MKITRETLTALGFKRIPTSESEEIWEHDYAVRVYFLGEAQSMDGKEGHDGDTACLKEIVDDLCSEAYTRGHETGFERAGIV